MGQLVAALLLFVGSHFLISSTPIRPALVRALGERLYTAFYSLLSLALFAWIIRSYALAPYLELWRPAEWTHWIPILVMPLATFLLIGGFTAPNPTAVMQAADFHGDAPAPGILSITRHPVMWAIALWALAHIPPNGDLASLLLFGSMAALALLGTVLIDRKKARTWPPGRWQAFASRTSNLPLAALASGRARLRYNEIGSWRLASAGLLYVALVWLHPWIAGVAAIGA